MNNQVLAQKRADSLIKRLQTTLDPTKGRNFRTVPDVDDSDNIDRSGPELQKALDVKLKQIEATLPVPS